ncbi:glycosyltransferase family 4 protein [Patescibacteria group bacterium]|nr:glycosyltransferase family 4 protein [Patescibacteria group bacterium]
MAQKLKIGIVSAGRFTVPPPKNLIFASSYIAQAIGEGLTAKGHEVFFFAPEGSKMKVTEVITGGLRPLHGISGSEGLAEMHATTIGEEQIAKFFLWDQYFISLMYEAALKKELDIISMHLPDRALPFARMTNIPTVYTLHDPIPSWRKEILDIYKSPHQYFVSLSDAQRKPAPDLQWIKTIYNGVNLDEFPFSEAPGESLLFLGRIRPGKGPDIAIQAAKAAQESLILVGDDPTTGSYVKDHIIPLLTEKIQYLGPIPHKETPAYYQKAKPLLAPIQWEEPFGLTYIESMACGTPVITFNRGSAPEIVKDGVTGFVVETFDEMVDAIKKIDQIDRRKCREHIEKNFSVQKMIDEYEKVFLNILKK